MITIPSIEFRSFDLEVPEDNRTDFEIELDAANRAQAKRNAARRAELMAMPRNDALWDAVTQKRLAAQQGLTIVSKELQLQG